MEPVHLITDSQQVRNWRDLQQVRNWTDGHLHFHTQPELLGPLNQPISLSSEVTEQLINKLTEWRYTNLGIGDGSEEKRRVCDRKVVVLILPFSSSSVFSHCSHIPCTFMNIFRAVPKGELSSWILTPRQPHTVISGRITHSRFFDTSSKHNNSLNHK